MLFRSDRTTNLLASKSITVTTTATGGGVDSDGDGMPDAWELANGLNAFANDANADPDGDGLSNLQEYLAGTNPNDPQSFLRIDAASDSANVHLSFFAVAGRNYSVLYRNEPGTGVWSKLADSPAQSTNRVVDLLVPQPLSPPARFYRLFIPPQP